MISDGSCHKQKWVNTFRYGGGLNDIWKACIQIFNHALTKENLSSICFIIFFLKAYSLKQRKFGNNAVQKTSINIEEGKKKECTLNDVKEYSTRPA